MNPKKKSNDLRPDPGKNKKPKIHPYQRTIYYSTILLAAPPTELVIDLSSQDNRLTREKY